MQPQQQYPPYPHQPQQPQPGQQPVPSHRHANSEQISPEQEARHQESKRLYPQLRLSAGEYVIETVRRHPIGLVSIWLVAGLIMLIVLALVPLYAANQAYIAHMFSVDVAKLPSPVVMMTPALIMVAFAALGGFIATIVYNGNRFFLTNESIIQFVQTSLFDTKQQVVNLINVEDASSTQHGILEQLLNYGTLRLSTQGEETIYHFRFTANPKRVVNEVNDAMEIAVRRMEGGAYPVTEY